MIKLLALSDAISGMTGFGSVTRDILKRLDPKEYDITTVGYNLPAGLAPYKKIEFINGEKLNIKTHPGGFGQFGIDRVMHLIKKEKPDIFFCLLDSFMLYQAGYQNQDLSPSKFIMYYPSDGEYFPLNCEAILRKTHTSVAMSKFAQNQVKNLFNIDSRYIPHGINSKNYYPIKDKASCKANPIFSHPNFKNKFICGAVFRNQPRKQPDLLLEAFAKFAKDKDDAVLLLHCDPRDPAAPVDLPFLIQRLGLLNKVFFTGMNLVEGFSLAQMNQLYNAFDIHVSASTGEGWGLCTTESMACGVPNIIPDYTTAKEIIKDSGGGFATRVNMEITGSWAVKRALADTDDMADKMTYLYENPDIRKEMGAKGREYVLKNYDYDKVVVPEFDRLFKEVYSR